MRTSPKGGTYAYGFPPKGERRRMASPQEGNLGPQGGREAIKGKHGERNLGVSRII